MPNARKGRLWVGKDILEMGWERSRLYDFSDLKSGTILTVGDLGSRSRSKLIKVENIDTYQRVELDVSCMSVS